MQATGMDQLTRIEDGPFRRIALLARRLAGINLSDGKRELVQARLAGRLRALRLTGYDEYVALLEGPEGEGELSCMLDALTTNFTSFFREPGHFEHLSRRLLAQVSAGAPRRLRVWSAGCSSGEEPYSIAIHLQEQLPDLARWDARILATDLSTRMLARARAGVYPASRFDDDRGRAALAHFTRTELRPPFSHRGALEQPHYSVKPATRGLVRFARLNLVEPWPMRGPFDAIFCRNVMIYFDKPTQRELLERLCGLLRPGGALFLGHSESLPGAREGLRYVQPTIYERS